MIFHIWSTPSFFISNLDSKLGPTPPQLANYADTLQGVTTAEEDGAIGHWKYDPNEFHMEVKVNKASHMKLTGALQKQNMRDAKQAARLAKVEKICFVNGKLFEILTQFYVIAPRRGRNNVKLE